MGAAALSGSLLALADGVPWGWRVAVAGFFLALGYWLLDQRHVGIYVHEDGVDIRNPNRTTSAAWEDVQGFRIDRYLRGYRVFVDFVDAPSIDVAGLIAPRKRWLESALDELNECLLRARAAGDGQRAPLARAS